MIIRKMFEKAFELQEKVSSKMIEVLDDALFSREPETMMKLSESVTKSTVEVIEAVRKLYETAAKKPGSISGVEGAELLADVDQVAGTAANSKTGKILAK